MSPLQTNEAVLAALARDSPMAIVVSTLADGQILDVNDTFLRLFGYSRDEVIGKTAAGLGLWADPAQRTELLSSLASEHAAGDYEATIHTKTGAKRQVLASVRHVTIDGSAYLLTQMYDVTTRKAAEKALREAEARFRGLFEGIADTIFVADADGRYLDANHAATALLGYDRKELLAMSIADLVANEPEWTATEYARYKAEGSWRGELELRRKDGSTVPVEGWASVVSLPTGPLYLSVVSDVSERKQSEALLKDSEKHFRALVQNSYDIVVVFDSAGTRTYVSPSVERLLGYPPTELLGRGREELVDPDDAAKLREAIQSCVRGATQTPVLELRFRHCDGSWREFEAVGTNLLDEPSVAGITFTSRDITARKAAEAALRESEDRFRGAFDHAATGMALVANDERFLQVNHSLSAPFWAIPRPSCSARPSLK